MVPQFPPSLVLAEGTATHRERIYATPSGDGNLNAYPIR